MKWFNNSKLVISFGVVLNLLFPSTIHAAEGNGVPIGEPSVVQNITLGSYSGTTTTRTISWSAPASDGGSAVTGYTAVAMTGADYTTPTAATCSVGGSTYSCSLVGMAYGSSYKIRMTAINAVGPSLAAFSAAFTTPSVSQTVTITSAPTSVAYGSGTSKLTAESKDTNTNTPTGLTISWSSSTTSICTIDNTGVATFISTGTCTIVATQDGSGTSYGAASATTNITVTTTVSATATGSSNLTGTGATLNGSVPYPGTNVSVVFCLSTTNSNSTCGSAGGTISIASPSTITSSTGSSTSAIATGLSAGATYYYWLEATGAGSTVKSSPSSFTTLISPVLALSGPTTGESGSAFSSSVTASSGSGVYSTWSVDSLPSGLALTPNGSQALISGTPTSAGSSTSIVTVTDSSGLSATLSITFTINAPTPPPTTPTPSNQTPVDTTIPVENVETAEQRAARIAAEEAAAKKALEEAAAKKAAEDAAAAKKAEEEAAAKKALEEAAAKKAAEDAAAKAASELEAKLGNPPGSTTPVVNNAGELPHLLSIGSLLIIVDGVEHKTDYKVIDSSILQVTFGSVQINLSLVSSDGSPKPITQDSPLTAQINDEVYFEGTGYLSGTKVTLWIFSTPINIGELPVGENGNFAGKIKLGKEIQIGQHTIQINGIDINKRAISVSMPAVVSEPKPNSIEEAVATEFAGQKGPGVTTPAFGKTVFKTVLFSKNSYALSTYEKKVIALYRKVISSKSVITCIGYVYSKTPKKTEKDLAYKQALASCKYLLNSKTAKFKTQIVNIKLLPKSNRAKTLVKKYPAVIQIFTPKK